MNEANTKYLLDKFKFFGYEEWKDDKKALHYTLMPFGLEVLDGWFELIKQLCLHIENVFHNARENAKYQDPPTPYIGNEHFRVIQVKEKYGSLRFYDTGAPGREGERIDGAISLATQMSHHICEVCGNKGQTYRAYMWYLTRCEECFKKEYPDLDPKDCL